MLLLPRIYNSLPVKAVHTGVFFHSLHDAYKNNENVVPSQRIAKIVTDVAKKTLLKGLPTLK